jgi:ATP-dependent DNA ligase
LNKRNRSPSTRNDLSGTITPEAKASLYSTIHGAGRLFGRKVPAQPIKQPPSSPDSVHEIKHGGYRLIARRDGPIVRLYTRNAYDWTVRLPAIAAAAVLPSWP